MHPPVHIDQLASIYAAGASIGIDCANCGYYHPLTPDDMDQYHDIMTDDAQTEHVDCPACARPLYVVFTVRGMDGLYIHAV